MVAATIKKIQAPNHEAAVLLVSGSPLENLLYTLTPPIDPTTANGINEYSSGGKIRGYHLCSFVNSVYAVTLGK